MDNAFALYTATAGNAAILGMEDYIGMVKEGMCADLIAMKQNPLEDLKALRHVSMVMANGALVDCTKLKKDEETERELDKFL